jgi:hypothetical protein
MSLLNLEFHNSDPSLQYNSKFFESLLQDLLECFSLENFPFDFHVGPLKGDAQFCIGYFSSSVTLHGIRSQIINGV